VFLSACSGLLRPCGQFAHDTLTDEIRELVRGWRLLAANPFLPAYCRSLTVAESADIARAARTSAHIRLKEGSTGSKLRFPDPPRLWQSWG